MDRSAVNRAITRIAHEIIEGNKGIENLAIIGIQRRGVPIAKMIIEKIEQVENGTPDFGILDITLYRDDLSLLFEHPTINGTDIPFQITGKKIILVDDVLFTGRTIRTAIDCIMDIGRPKCIQLAVLIDRGHRELPIRADYIGKNVPTSLNELIHVQMDSIDGEQNVLLCENSDN